MKSKRKISISFLSFVMLSGCAQSSGVLQLGPNTYSIVTANELGGVIAAKKSGVQEAAAFCIAKGQQMAALQTQSNVRPDFVGDPVAHHDLTFQCIPQ